MLITQGNRSRVFAVLTLGCVSHGLMGCQDVALEDTGSLAQAVTFPVANADWVAVEQLGVGLTDRTPTRKTTDGTSSVPPCTPRCTSPPVIHISWFECGPMTIRSAVRTLPNTVGGSCSRLTETRLLTTTCYWRTPRERTTFLRSTRTRRKPVGSRTTPKR